MNTDTADLIFDVLVRRCGANESHRNGFVYHATHDARLEYRFQGKLGFGGKFYADASRWVVGYYSEDATRERDEMVRTANADLADLWKLSSK